MGFLARNEIPRTMSGDLADPVVGPSLACVGPVLDNMENKKEGATGSHAQRASGLLGAGHTWKSPVSFWSLHTSRTTELVWECGLWEGTKLCTVNQNTPFPTSHN
jgi:hypothetical protein